MSQIEFRDVHNPVLVFAPCGDYIAIKSQKRKVEFDNSYKGIVDQEQEWSVSPDKKLKSPKRSVITEFTKKSRSRLQSKIAQVDRNCIPVFMTLTYAKHYSEEYQDYKQDLNNLWVRMRRKFPNVGMIWKLEFQKRGAPHYHCLVWGVDVEQLRQYIPLWWLELAGHGDVNHIMFHMGLLPGSEHCVQAVKSWNGVKSYASKYLSKGVGSACRSGRFWGVCGAVPFAELLEFPMTYAQALEFKRDIQIKTFFLHERFGFWMYGEKYYDWLIRWICTWEDVPESPPVWLELDESRWY